MPRGLQAMLSHAFLVSRKLPAPVRTAKTRTIISSHAVLSQGGPDPWTSRAASASADGWYERVWTGGAAAVDAEAAVRYIVAASTGRRRHRRSSSRRRCRASLPADEQRPQPPLIPPRSSTTTGRPAARRQQLASTDLHWRHRHTLQGVRRTATVVGVDFCIMMTRTRHAGHWGSHRVCRLSGIRLAACHLPGQFYCLAPPTRIRQRLLYPRWRCNWRRVYTGKLVHRNDQLYRTALFSSVRIINIQRK